MSNITIMSVDVVTSQESSNDELYFNVDGKVTKEYSGSGSIEVGYQAPFDGSVNVTLWEADGNWLDSDDKIATEDVTDLGNKDPFHITFKGSGAEYNVWFDVG